MIKVLIVEDSPVVRDFLTYILSSDPELEVVGTANNGMEACQAVARLHPNVVTMDINMPRMDGFEATRRIMETHPVPIVIISGVMQADEVATTFRAMEAGALAFQPRPFGIGHANYEATARELVKTVKLMAEVKVVRRWPITRKPEPACEMTPAIAVKPAAEGIKLVAIGASTGGPLVIRTILNELPPGFPAPVMIVQHMVSEFIPGFVEWLRHTVCLDVRLAANGEDLQAGKVYIAPGGCQTGIAPGGKIALTQAPAWNGHRPSVSYLFRAAADIFSNEAIGVLLTGMGNDGAAELRLMREKGAVTIAQNEPSSTVFGMPGEAVKLKAATYVLPPEQIAATIREVVTHPLQVNDSKGTCP